MMTVPTMKTVILILERIPMMARTENYIISHMIGMILTHCFGNLVVILQFYSLINKHSLPGGVVVISLASHAGDWGFNHRLRQAVQATKL